MSVIRYRALVDIHTPGQNPGLPFEMVERALVMTLFRLQVKSLGDRGRVELAELEIEDWTLQDRAAQSEQRAAG
jgi:hypothetical protein